MAMSRRSIALVAVFLGALLVANILFLAIWLPGRKSNETKSALANSITSAPAPAAPSISASSPAAKTAGNVANRAESAGDFALERQLTSSSRNIRISYFRNRNSKLRRVTVEDVKHPGASTVLSESKQTVWVLVSPDDQWIAVNERDTVNGGSVRLYRRDGDSSGRYVPADDTGPQGRTLQEAVWQSYANSSHLEPNAPRRNVTVDATAWENDSRRLDLAVAYLATRDNPDVPEPWNCSYDVVSKQIEVAPNQLAPGVNTAAADQQGPDAGSPAEGPGQEMTAAKHVSEDAQDSQADSADDAELPGERFPATRLDELTVPDVNESSLADINYAINEMYARHGAEFKDRKVAKEFSEFSWYKPRLGLGFDQIENEFSDLEKANLKVLRRCRDAKVAAAHRQSRPVRGEKVEEETTGQKILRGFRAWQDAGAPVPPHP
jgi:YARHG domain